VVAEHPSPESRHAHHSYAYTILTLTTPSHPRQAPDLQERPDVCPLRSSTCGTQVMHCGRFNRVVGHRKAAATALRCFWTPARRLPRRRRRRPAALPARSRPHQPARPLPLHQPRQPRRRAASAPRPTHRRRLIRPPHTAALAEDPAPLLLTPLVHHGCISRQPRARRSSSISWLRWQLVSRQPGTRVPATPSAARGLLVAR